MRKNSQKTFMLPLVFQLAAEEKLKEILKQNIKKTIEKNYKDFIEDKALRVVNNIEIKEVNILYLPFIRMKGSMDVDWSCVEILRDFDRQIDRYIGRTGKSFKEFDMLIPIANTGGREYGELYAYRFQNVEFKSIKDFQFIDLSDNMTQMDFPSVPLEESEEWIDVQIERKMHDLANSISYNVKGRTESTQECHKLTLDNEVSGVVYYLPNVSYKYRYLDREYDWDFLINPEQYRKPMSALQFQNEEDREAVRMSINAFREKMEKERERKLNEEKEAKEKKRNEKQNRDHIQNLESYIVRLNNSNFGKEQRNVFLTVVILCCLLCLIWAFIIMIDNQHHWSRHNLPEFFTWLFSLLAISELLVVLFGDSGNSLSEKLAKISDPLPELIEKVAKTKTKLKRRTMIRWAIIVGSILMIVLIQLLSSWSY